jgi:quercetin dioxygenase-like cupin family protein
MPKSEREFTSVEAFPWKPVEGYPAGVYERILSVDEATGFVTRLVRFDPGVETAGTLTHDFWEEVYILEGRFVQGEQVFTAGMYACRPPGMKHGPYKTPIGCLTFEVRYFRSPAS